MARELQQCMAVTVEMSCRLQRKPRFQTVFIHVGLNRFNAKVLWCSCVCHLLYLHYTHSIEWRVGYHSNKTPQHLAKMIFLTQLHKN
ncbi:unnamed protein product [Cuscuta campestris]|uniref:Uncharacterized protein n=1 Tax=Cuscuta campestris TaxID=132261 RepID=A0A484LYX4_9ASTE|nr:unnamed protein product [Cuscuta campestris]